MTVEVWMLMLIAAAVAAGFIGFAIGKRGAADDKRINELEAELSAAQARQRELDDGINEHFEESAELFGQLARDYRQFYQHFAASAGKLGVSEDRTEAMLEATRSRLLADEREVDGAVQESTIEEPVSEASDEEPSTRVADVSMEPGEAATDKRPDDKEGDQERVA